MTNNVKDGLWLTIKGIVVVVVAGLFIAWASDVSRKSAVSVSASEARTIAEEVIAASPTTTRGAEIFLQQNNADHQLIKAELGRVAENQDEILRNQILTQKEQVFVRTRQDGVIESLKEIKAILKERQKR